ncbi:putative MFS transporter [Xylariaceae sp. FL0594]|nr:putative MFS transporter [Xylariaceae sp. FL0594]
MPNRQLEAERSLHNQVNILPRGKLMVVFGVLAVSQLISFCDQNGIGVTLPTIAKDLHAESTISWAGTSSLIANTMFQMLYGRLSDIFGRKAVWLGAIACLCIATLLCSMSSNATMFYVFRGVAGIGGGGISNLSMIIVSDIVTLENRGKWQGIIGSCVGLGNVLGPFLAASLITHATWRAFFWVLSPLAAIVGVISAWLLPSTPPTLPFRESVTKIDYGGVLTSSLGVVLLLIPISGGGSYFKWSSPMVTIMIAIGAASLVGFVVWEARGARLPMMPVTNFRNPAVSLILLESFCFGAVYQSYLYYLPLYLQNARQYSVLRSAGAIATMAGAQALSSVAAGFYLSKFKRWKEVLCGGFALWTLGTGLVLLFNRHTSMGMIIAPLVIMGIGAGSTLQPTLVALQSHVLKSRRAVIISNRNFFRCGGGAAGLAISAAVLQAVLRESLPAGYKSLANNAYALPKLEGDEFEGVIDAYMAASRAVFILQVPIMSVCLLTSLFLKDHGLGHPEEDDGNNSAGMSETHALETGNNSQRKEEGILVNDRPVTVSIDEPRAELPSNEVVQSDGRRALF